MTRGKQDKLYRSFNKGLITEAGFLTYPEDASIDELNTVIYRKGNRTRRAGIDFEPDSVPQTFHPGVTVAEVTNEYVWKGPGDKGDLNFLCVQVGSMIYFFDMSAQPLSGGRKGFTVNLINYKLETASDEQVKMNRVHMASGKGFLFLAQNFIEPVSVTYDQNSDTITPIPVLIQIRDFDGVNDGYANDYEPSTLTKEHNYNLVNQGWLRPGSASDTPSTPGSDTGTGGGVDGGGGYYNPWTGTTYTDRQYEEIP